MRCKNIEMTMMIPFPVNEPDENGVIYTKDAVVSAFKDVAGKPIITYENDQSVCIGVVTSEAKINETSEVIFAEVSGRIYFGGTEESVELDEDCRVKSMELKGIGFSR